MIEMPEAATIAGQMNQTLIGKTIARFGRGSKTHKFLWLNRPDQEFKAVMPGLTVTGAGSFGRSIYLHLGQFRLSWHETGGKLLYHEAGAQQPKSFHLGWEFTDGSSLTFALQMWGAVKLLGQPEAGKKPVDETGVEPTSPEFTLERFDQMLEEYSERTSKGIKGFLVATGYAVPNHIAGLGNAIVQDILFQTGISPKRKTSQIQPDERKRLYDSINTTIEKAIELGGRYDEVDLYGQPGGYIRLMDSRTVGAPCGTCGKTIEKISYLGGACYLCPACQT